MNMGVIFITHDMGVVAEVADRVLVMYRGEKVEEGASERIFARPRIATRVRCSRPCRGSARCGHRSPAKFPC
jgi:ABC-type dipeptide/oligopeptide/nickel transport system ATPase component